MLLPVANRVPLSPDQVQVVLVVEQLASTGCVPAVSALSDAHSPDAGCMSLNALLEPASAHCHSCVALGEMRADGPQGVRTSGVPAATPRSCVSRHVSTGLALGPAVAACHTSGAAPTGWPVLQ
jgi:hypothetical protein